MESKDEYLNPMFGKDGVCGHLEDVGNMSVIGDGGIIDTTRKTLILRGGWMLELSLVMKLLCEWIIQEPKHKIKRDSWICLI